jgi:hypothetical protein
MWNNCSLKNQIRALKILNKDNHYQLNNIPKRKIKEIVLQLQEFRILETEIMPYRNGCNLIVMKIIKMELKSFINMKKNRIQLGCKCFSKRYATDFNEKLLNMSLAVN